MLELESCTACLVEGRLALRTCCKTAYLCGHIALHCANASESLSVQGGAVEPVQLSKQLYKYVMLHL
jgi:hypothetical protein